MFKVGDKVIRLDLDSPHIYSIMRIEEGVFTIGNSFRQKHYLRRINMSFISHNNNITLEDIDLDKHFITVSYCGKSIVYSWTGSCKYRPDFDDLVGEYIDTNHNIKLVFNPEHSDDNIDDDTLSALEYNRDFVIEHIVQQIYIKEMGK